MGRPQSVRDRLGDVLMPSAVAVVESQVLVGREAVQAAVVTPERYADCFKRDMGRTAFRSPVGGKRVPPEVLSALVLERLKQEAERVLGPVGKAVITVPAYFDELRRKATQDAGRLGGWEVLDIINEPAAAALCCGQERGFFGLGQGRPGGRECVVVYDLGGGTFDVSLLEIDPTTFRTVATNGDFQLGGRDFDERLVAYLAERFLAAHRLDPRTDPRDAFRLWQEAQKAKHALSEHEKTSAVCAHAGIRMQIDLTRDVFEDLVADLLERTRVTTDLLVREAGLGWNDVDRVLLSGGATRMPMVSRILRELTGKEPDSSLSPDEAVAHGAALYAGMLLGGPGSSGPRRCELIHVNSHSLGVVGVEEKSREHVNAVLIPRNTPIPAQAVKSFRTFEEGQRDVAVPVVEGESERPEFCVLLGKCVVRDLPPRLPKGTWVDVAYRYLANGRLAVSAWVPDSGQSAEVEILRDRPAIRGTLVEWKERLLGGRPSPPEVGDARSDALPEVDLNDRTSVIKRLDALYMRVGRLAEKLTVPRLAGGSQRLVAEARAELNAKSRTVADVEGRREGAVGMGEAVQWGVELSRAQVAQRQAADYLFYACLVLGRECVQNGFCPPGAEADLEEIRRLRRFLK